MSLLQSYVADDFFLNPAHNSFQFQSDALMPQEWLQDLIL